MKSSLILSEVVINIVIEMVSMAIIIEVAIDIIIDKSVDRVSFVVNYLFSILHGQRFLPLHYRVRSHLKAMIDHNGDQR